MEGIAAYQETAIGTQSKGRLIVMLYDGAIKFMKLAVKEMERGNHAGKGQYINRVAISSTMGPGVKVDPSTLAPAGAEK